MVNTAWMVVAFGALLSVAEAANPSPARRGSHPGRSYGAIGWIALYVLYVPVLGSGIVVMTIVLSRWSPAAGLVTRLPVPLQVAAAFVLAELFVYWVHRLEHSVPLLWRVHAVHHRPVPLRWWSTYRFHPVDTALSHVVPAAGVALCGCPPGALAVHAAVVTVVVLFAHADVYLPALRLQRLVVTPDFHRTHHDPAREQHNLALVLPVMDALFGTSCWTPPGRLASAGTRVA